MRGRRPKPSYMRVLSGNAGKRPINEDEPLPPGKLEELPPPDRLNEQQKQIWRETIADAPPGLLRRLDTAVFEQWVIHCYSFREAAAQVSRLGLLLKSKDTGTPYQNPFLSIMNRQSKDMRALAAELGFTPSSRSRVRIDPKTPGQGDPFADLKSITD